MNKQSKFAVVKHFKTEIKVNKAVFSVGGVKQGTRPPIVKVFKKGDASLFGMVSTKGIGIAQAFDMALSILKAMARSDIAMTKPSFYERRTQLYKDKDMDLV